MDPLEKANIKKFVGILVGIAVLFWIVWPHLMQSDPAAYFNFADDRHLVGIPNFSDVFSNISFLIFGIFGICNVWRCRKLLPLSFLILGSFLALAAILTAAGSAYFHWEPSPARLVWDRLPMTIGFSAIVGLISADRVSEKMGIVSFALMLPIGLFSVWGYQQGTWTLKPYLAVQFGAMILIFLAVLLFKARFLGNQYVWPCLRYYALAKVLEVLDRPIYEFTGFVSGHTLKHFCAALALYKVFNFYRNTSTSEIRQADGVSG